MATRLRDFGMWVVTAIDDVVVERFWRRLRRGQIGPAFAVWGEFLTGWWGCAALLALIVIAIVLLLA